MNQLRITLLDRFRGCILGGAVGDALGAQIEFDSIQEIRRRYGTEGLMDYPERIGYWTDDTQMLIWTGEGLLRAETRGRLKGIVSWPEMCWRSYLRWLRTQGETSRAEIFEEATRQEKNGWLIQEKGLYARRAPGNTCISALKSVVMGTIERPLNSSKGCGGVMRVAPVGLWFHDDPEQAFRMGCEAAAITHGHVSGFLPSGLMAAIIAFILSGKPVYESIRSAINILRKYQGQKETLAAVEKALDYAETKQACPETIEQLGAGWVGEEALSISIFCALVSGSDFEKAVLLAVNHSGDSDSTGSITGNIMGALIGSHAIPLDWIRRLEMREVIEQLSSDLFEKFEDETGWWERYPGW